MPSRTGKVVRQQVQTSVVGRVVGLDRRVVLGTGRRGSPAAAGRDPSRAPSRTLGRRTSSRTASMVASSAASTLSRSSGSVLDGAQVEPPVGRVDTVSPSSWSTVTPSRPAYAGSTVARSRPAGSATVELISPDCDVAVVRREQLDSGRALGRRRRARPARAARRASRSRRARSRGSRSGPSARRRRRRRSRPSPP